TGSGTASGSGAGACCFSFLPNEISFFQMDCLGSSGVVGSDGDATGSDFASLPLRLNEISFFQTDAASSPGSGGGFGAFGLRRNEISFFQTDCSSTTSSRRRGDQRRAPALPRPQCRRDRPRPAGDQRGIPRARGSRSAAAVATTAPIRPRG